MQTKAEAAERLKTIAVSMKVLGLPENAEAARMGAEVLSAPPEIFMGYRIAELQVLADLLREQNVSPITVSRLCNDASYMCQLLKAQFAKEVREAMTPPKLSPWEEEKEGEQ